MSTTRIAILGLAIGAAVLAAFLAKGFLGTKPKQQIVKVEKTEVVEILVAAKDIKVGGLLDRAAVRWQKWPKDVVKPGMISRKSKPDAQEKFQSARARTTIFEGEPLQDRKVVYSGDSGFMAAVLPKGMRAISVRVSVETGAGGFILPNDHVDVLLTRKAERFWVIEPDIYRHGDVKRPGPSNRPVVRCERQGRDSCQREDQHRDAGIGPPPVRSHRTCRNNRTTDPGASVHGRQRQQ